MENVINQSLALTQNLLFQIQHIISPSLSLTVMNTAEKTFFSIALVQPEEACAWGFRYSGNVAEEKKTYLVKKEFAEILGGQYVVADVRVNTSKLHLKLSNEGAVYGEIDGFSKPKSESDKASLFPLFSLEVPVSFCGHPLFEIPVPNNKGE